MAPIADGDRVRLHYTGRLADGSEFDTSYGREPIEFVVGSDQLIDGVNQALIGMEVGEKKTVRLPPELGYGEPREDMKIRVKRAQIPDDAVVGAILGLSTEDQQIRAVLVELGDDDAVLDANHPLAGKTLEFDLEIVAIGD